MWGSIAHAVEVYCGRRLLGMCWFGGGKQGDVGVWFAWVLLRGISQLVRSGSGLGPLDGAAGVSGDAVEIGAQAVVQESVGAGPKQARAVGWRGTVCSFV